jgi:hypothetical protein
MIEFILTHKGEEMERDTISQAAALELITGAVKELYKVSLTKGEKMEHPLKQIKDIAAAVDAGQTVSIDNKDANTSMIFQTKRTVR